VKRPEVSLTVRIFERESELKEALKLEFSRQLGDLYVCSEPDCSFRYVDSPARNGDPVVRMLVHRYIHLINSPDSRTSLQALNRVLEMLDPPRERVTSGAGEVGVLTEAERRLLQLEDDED